MGTVSAARRERRGVSPRGRGRGRSGAVGGGRDRVGMSRGDPARSSRGKRGGGRGRAGVPRRCPREPRKCLLRPTRRDRSRAEGAAGTRRDAPSPGLLARCAARSRSGTPGRATAPPLCAPWRVRDCRRRASARPMESAINGSYKTCSRRVLRVSLVSFPRRRLFYFYLSRTIDGETRVRYVNPFTVRDSRFRSSFPFRDFSCLLSHTSR